MPPSLVSSSVVGIVVAFVLTAIPAGVGLGLGVYICNVHVQAVSCMEALVTVVTLIWFFCCVHNLLVEFDTLEAFATYITFLCWFVMLLHVALEKCFVSANLLTCFTYYWLVVMVVINVVLQTLLAYFCLATFCTHKHLFMTRLVTFQCILNFKGLNTPDASKPSHVLYLHVPFFGQSSLAQAILEKSIFFVDSRNKQQKRRKAQ